MRLQPGALRFEAIFQRTAPTNNGKGTVVETPVEFGRAFGDLQEVYGGEWKIGPALQGIQTHWFYGRFLEGVTTQMIAVIDGETYRVLQPPKLEHNSGRSGWMEVRLQKITTP